MDCRADIGGQRLQFTILRDGRRGRQLAEVAFKDLDLFDVQVPLAGVEVQTEIGFDLTGIDQAGADAFRNFVYLIRNQLPFLDTVTGFLPGQIDAGDECKAAKCRHRDQADLMRYFEVL
jgi:hypothetical protein